MGCDWCSIFVIVCSIVDCSSGVVLSMLVNVFVVIFYIMLFCRVCIFVEWVVLVIIFRFLIELLDVILVNMCFFGVIVMNCFELMI